MDQRFQELVAFEQQHGHISVTNGAGDAQLEGWTNAQQHNDSDIGTDRRDALRAFGVVSKENFRKDQWEESFHLLSQLFIERGSACEPDKNSPLGLWTAQQRNLHSSGLLHQDRKDDLDKIGFSWTPPSKSVVNSPTSGDSVVEQSQLAANWNAMFAELVRHREIFGNCLVCTRYDASLCSWVHVQRQRQNDESLPRDREEQLNELGFVWNDEYTPFAEQIWEHKYSQLEAFREVHGHCEVNDSNCVDDDLIVWVKAQRSRRHARPDRVAKLDLLGFAWNLKPETIIMAPKSKEVVDEASSRGCFHSKSSEEKWNAKYELTLKHYQQFGHTFVNKGTSTLYNWIHWQRTLHLEGTLCKCREERLNKIHSGWSEVIQTNEQRWDTMYERLKAYHEEHGTCLVGSETSNNRQLQSWMSGQRAKLISGSMMPDRKAKLGLLGLSSKADEGDVLHPEGGVDTANTIGFASNHGRPLSLDDRWEVMYERLKAYKEKHRHCRVRYSEGNDEKQLKIWLTRQRKAWRMNHRPDRIARLDLLGFFWNDEVESDVYPWNRAPPQGTKRVAEHLEEESEDEQVTVEAAPVENPRRGMLIGSHLCEEECDRNRKQDGCASEKPTLKGAAPDDVLQQIQKVRHGTLGCSSTPPALELQDRQEPHGRLPCLQVNDKNNNHLVGRVCAQLQGNRVHWRPDREAKFELLGLRRKSQKDNDDDLPHSSAHPRVKKQAARQSENTGRGTEMDKALDASVINLCESTDSVSSKQRVCATTRNRRKTTTPIRARLNIVIREKLDSSEGGEIRKEPNPVMIGTSKDPSTMVGGNLAINHNNVDTGSEDCSYGCIPSRDVFDDDLEAVLKGREKHLPAVRREVEMTNKMRKRRRLLDCPAPMNLHDSTEDLVKASFPTGSIGLRVMAKLQEKKQKANSAGRFRRNCGL